MNDWDDDEDDGFVEMVKYVVRSHVLTIAVFFVSIVAVLAAICWRSMDAEVCVTARDSDGQPLTGCSVNFSGLEENPKPKEGEEACGGPGKYYFDHVPIPDDPEYELSVTCYEFTRKSSVLLLDHEIAHADVVFEGGRISGKFYPLKPEYRLTPSHPRLELSGQLCRAQGKVVCQPLTEAEMRPVKIVIPNSCKELLTSDDLTLTADLEKLRKQGNDSACKIGIEFPKQYVELQLFLSGWG